MLKNTVVKNRWETVTFVDSESGSLITGVLEFGHNTSVLMLKSAGYTAKDNRTNKPNVAMLCSLERIEDSHIWINDMGPFFFGQLVLPTQTKKIDLLTIDKL